MSLLIATGRLPYHQGLAKRSSLIAALQEEWRDIIATKSVLFSCAQLEKLELYLAPFCKLSETIDNMRSLSQRRRDH
ncbi:MAG TPA: hypothetical protein VHI72_15960 [Hyphomicrobiaceae bacterium]|jgi:hypothetical protein|nr:hypothetical protein [Hyphomicrobiaceae bacterium]